MKVNPTKTVDELISALSYIIDSRGNSNLYHAWRVAILSAHIAKNKATKKGVKDIFYAGLLSDVSGVEFTRHITYYLKRGDEASKSLLLSHPIISAQLVSNIPLMTSAAKLILDHHEWANGTGYPRAKTGKMIPFGSQVIRVSDSIDTALQGNPRPTLRELRKRMALNVNKEYAEGLLTHAFRILNKGRFFYRISKNAAIPGIFKKTRALVGRIRIPLGIDAIGTTLEVIAHIIDMKHPYTAGHSHRVARYALSCALAMRMEHDEVTRIRWAGLIHDIGKLNVSRSLLDKPARLKPKEFKAVKKHAFFTHKIIEMVPTLKNIVGIAAGHHEYFDGSGYPYGLKGKNIPLGARILCICDAFDAMTSNRPYRKPLTPLAACREIEKKSGTQFDPEVTRQIIPVFKNLYL